MPPSPETLLSFIDYADLLRVAMQWYLVLVVSVFGVLSLASLVSRFPRQAAPRRPARVTARSMHLPFGGGHHAH